MSLINDALKRAKQAQEQAPAPTTPGPQFRPVEPAQIMEPKRSFIVPVTFAVLGATILVLLVQLWYLSGTPRSVVKVAAAQKVPVAAPVVEPAAEPEPAIVPEPLASASPVQESPVPLVAAPFLKAAAFSAKTPYLEPSAPVATSAPARQDKPAAAAETPAPPASEPPAQSQEPAAVVSPPAPVKPALATPVKPGVIKLQGIVFHPTRPSAMINGRTFFVGDQVGDFRLSEIDRTGVTLTDGRQPPRLILTR